MLCSVSSSSCCSFVWPAMSLAFVYFSYIWLDFNLTAFSVRTLFSFTTVLLPSMVHGLHERTTVIGFEGR